VIERLPYPVDSALKLLKGTAHLILVGTRPPVSFFAYPGMPSALAPKDCQIHTLANAEENIVGALEALVEELNAPREPATLYALNRPALPTGKITPAKVWAALSALMPEHAIISDEAITSGRDSEEWTTGAPPHDWLNITGGAIGQGMPVAVGAAIACPERKVFSMQSDGAAMYTLQALWTQAREKLDIVTLLFSNRRYAILQGELKRLGGDSPGPKAMEMLEIGNPELKWVKLAQGMGIHATRATTGETFGQQLETAIRSSGPHLIEVVL
jgi:acetolactate synthase-1/2/3 large subunit